MPKSPAGTMQCSADSDMDGAPLFGSCSGVSSQHFHRHRLRHEQNKCVAVDSRRNFPFNKSRLRIPKNSRAVNCKPLQKGRNALQTVPCCCPWQALAGITNFLAEKLVEK